jgi:dynein heavy chain
VGAEAGAPQAAVASVADLKQLAPLLVELRSPAMRPRHWAEVFELFDQPPLPPGGFTLQHLLAWGAREAAAELSEIAQMAAGEYALEVQIQRVRDTWGHVSFSVVPHGSGVTAPLVLSAVEEVVAVLEEDQAALQSLLASRFAEGVRKEALAWEARLAHLSETLDEWVACQRGWMYLVDTSPPRP